MYHSSSSKSSSMVSPEGVSSLVMDGCFRCCCWLVRCCCLPRLFLPRLPLEARTAPRVLPATEGGCFHIDWPNRGEAWWRCYVPGLLHQHVSTLAETLTLTLTLVTAAGRGHVERLAQVVRVRRGSLGGHTSGRAEGADAQRTGDSRALQIVALLLRPRSAVQGMRVEVLPPAGRGHWAMAGGRGAGGGGGPAPRMRHLHHGELLLRVAARQGVVLLVWKINRENINNFTNLKKKF